MNQDLRNKNFSPGSLRRDRSARTVLLRMARDDARAARIRALYEEVKDERGDEITWRLIADACGVSERAAAAWPKTGGIAYENAKKLAAFFRTLGKSVDVDYIWRGPEVQTPDLIGAMHDGNSAQLDRIEAYLLAIGRHLGVRLEEIDVESEVLARALAGEQVERREDVGTRAAAR
jgi:hypothetical protein